MGIVLRRGGRHCHSVSKMFPASVVCLDVPALIRTGAGASSAVLDAVVAPLLADVEGQGLAVLGDVGGDVVLAHAAVLERVGVALVLVGGHGGHAGLLQADERALRLLVEAPCVWHMLGWSSRNGTGKRTSVTGRDAVGVNGVGVVELGRVLAGGETGESSNAEGDGGTHCG